MDLILDLCQTPLNLTQCSQTSKPHPLSQSVCCSQSVGQSLVKKMERSHSVVSEKSLFSSSPSPVTSSPKRTEYSELHVTTHSTYKDNIEKEEDVCRDIQKSQRDSLDKRSITPVGSMNVSRFGTILDSSLDTSIDEPSDVLEDQMFSGRQTSQQPVSVVDSDSKLPVIELKNTDSVTQAVERAENISKPLSISTTPTQSRLKNARAVENSEPDLVSDMDLVIPSSPLTSPLPLSPQSKELQTLLAETFKTYHSSHSNEEGTTKPESLDPKYSGSEFDIPCAQAPHTQNLGEAMTSRKEFGLSDVDPTWNPESWYTSDSQSPFKYSKSGSKADMGLEQDIQLEYDMPEIETSNYGVSDDSLIQSLESESYVSQSQQTVEAIKEEEEEKHPSQLSAGDIRNRLLKLCTTPDHGDCEGGDSVHLVEGDSGDSEVEESFWMSQQVWDDIDKQSDKMSSPNFKVGLPTITSVIINEDETTDDASERDDNIPQLDGGGGSPAGKRQKSPKKKVIKHKKTLGLKRRQPKKRPLPQSSPYTSDVVSSMQSVVSTDVTCKKDSEKGATHYSLRKQESSSDGKEKHRLSLSLKKGQSSKATKDNSKPLPSNEETISMEKNCLLDRKLVEQALTSGFTLELTKLPFTMPAHPASPRTTVVTPSSKHSQQHRRKRRRREDVSGGAELSDKKKKANPPLKWQKKYQTRSLTKEMSLKKGSPVEPTDDLTELTHEQQIRLAIDQSLKHCESQSSSTEAIECAKTAIEAKKHEMSPALFSPRSDSAMSDLDLNRTIIEESPFREDVEGYSDKGSHVKCGENNKENLNEPIVEQDRDVRNLLEEGAVKGCDELLDPNTSFKDAIEAVDSNGELDTSINSIAESPPFTSSPIDLNFELCIDTDTNPSSIGSPIHTSSQDKTQDNPLKSDPATTFATMETLPTLVDISASFGGPCVGLVQLEIPKLQNLAKEVLGFSAPQHLASPANLRDHSMDTSDSHYQGSKEGLADILDDFHLAVSSESEGEWTCEEGENLELSSGQEHISSHVTLRREHNERYRYAHSPSKHDLPTVTAAGISEGVIGEKLDLSVGYVSKEDKAILATCCVSWKSEDSEPQKPVDSSDIRPSLDRSTPKDTSECISTNRHDSSTLASTSILNRVTTAASEIEQPSDVVIVTPAIAPPPTQYLMETLSSYGLPSARHTQPFYSIPDDTQHPK